MVAIIPPADTYLQEADQLAFQSDTRLIKGTVFSDKWWMRWLIQLSILLGALACAPEKPPLEVDVAPWNAFVLPGSERVCGSSSDGAGPRLRFNNVTLTWDKPEQLIIVAIQVKVPASGKLTADISCTVAGDELDAMFGFTQSGTFSSAPDEAYKDASKTQLTNKYCALKCFGIPVDMDQKKGFTARGKAKVFAYKIGSDGNQEPTNSEVAVAVTYLP